MRTQDERPKSVVIGATVWRVSWAQADWAAVLNDPEHHAVAKEADGLTMASEARILVRPGQDPAIERDTFLHEILHAIFATFGFHYQGSFKGYQGEERMILNITPYLLMVLRDNAKVVKYLCQPS